MRIWYCPVIYLDDDSLMELHQTYHRIENDILFKSNKPVEKYKYFFFNFPHRRNWFLQIHDKVLSELIYRFKKNKEKYIHRTPTKMSPSKSVHTWNPPLDYINNDINTLKIKYRFKDKRFKYTNRNLPNFLNNIKRDLEHNCKYCINNKTCNKIEKEKYNKCNLWNNGEFIYKEIFQDPVSKLTIP